MDSQRSAASFSGLMDNTIDWLLTMAAYFHSEATLPSSWSFLILVEITVISLEMEGRGGCW